MRESILYRRAAIAPPAERRGVPRWWGEQRGAYRGHPGGLACHHSGGPSSGDLTQQPRGARCGQKLWVRIPALLLEAG